MVVVIMTNVIAMRRGRFVAAKRFIVDGVFTPIVMVSFPGVEAFLVHRVKRQPHVIGSEIEIGSADHSYIFSTVPDIRIRDRLFDDYWSRRRCGRGHDNGRRRRNANLYRHACFQ